LLISIKLVSSNFPAGTGRCYNFLIAEILSQTFRSHYEKRILTPSVFTLAWWTLCPVGQIAEKAVCRSVFLTTCFFSDFALTRTKTFNFWMWRRSSLRSSI